MPGDNTTGNLILGAAVVAAAWFVSAPLRGAGDALGDAGGFVGNVANGTTGFVAESADAVSGAVGTTFGGATDVATGTGNFVDGIVSGGSQIVNDTLAVPGDTVDAVTNWKFTGF